ncbi:hypothetical protein HDU83_004232 [Entophlyctis luteolus]|nr:hypothetical protein HDU83_004232 [Entophlyctis luteolus]KAJ3377287.1 hypothetical protein HDU84_008794 [Entophlyctis sp. JEL0112]
MRREGLANVSSSSSRIATNATTRYVANVAPSDRTFYILPKGVTHEEAVARIKRVHLARELLWYLDHSSYSRWFNPTSLKKFGIQPKPLESMQTEEIATLRSVARDSWGDLWPSCVYPSVESAEKILLRQMKKVQAKGKHSPAHNCDGNKDHKSKRVEWRSNLAHCLK